MELAPRWKDASREFEREAASTVPADVLKDMKSKGWKKRDLGKLLEKTDRAVGLEKRRVAWATANEVVRQYRDVLGQAEEDRRTSQAGKRKLKTLMRVLDGLLIDAEELNQDPKPSGRATDLRLISAMDLSSGVKLKNFKVGKLSVSVWLDMDEALLDLEKSGELGYHWSEVQRNIEKMLGKWKKKFAETLVELDTTIGALSGKERDRKVREAKQVLEYYRKLLEKVVNQVPDAYWERAKKRKKYLVDFKSECRTDIVMGVVAIGVSATSIAVSFGTTSMSVLVIVKSALEIINTIDKLDRSAERVRRLLQDRIDETVDIWKDRQQAIADGDTRYVAKTGEGARELLAQVGGPLTEHLFRNTGRTLKVAKEYVGKLTPIETEAGKLYKQISEFTAKFPTAPESGNPAADAQMLKAHQQFMVAAEQYATFRRQLKSDIRWGEKAVSVCEALKREDAPVDWVATLAPPTKTTLAIGAALRLTLHLLKPLIPVDIPGT